MENTNLKNNRTFWEDIKNIHFVGIGGVSVSALCKLSWHLGYNVSGSDIVMNDEIDKLQRLGIGIAFEHSPKNIDEDCELVVYSSAISPDNVELMEAKKRNIRIMERAEFLAEISSLYKNVIAVAGSHGKTTTTAMIGHIFKIAGLNPTIHLGGNVRGYGNLNLGSNDYLITEACEYRNSIKWLKPNTAVITNVDNDHLDFYKTEKNLIKAFQNFANLTKNNLIVASERKFRQINRLNKLYSVGLNDNQNVYAKNIKTTKKGFKFNVVYNGKNLGKFKLNVWGKHNIKNVLYAITVAMLYNIKLGKIKKAVKTFINAERRYEKIGKYNNLTVISDYAHHPTEIKNSILGLKKHFKKLLVVFQPHTYSRTKILLNDFKNAFINADGIIIFKTYPAREPYNKYGDENVLYKNISNKHKFIANTIEEVFDILDTETNIKNYDAIVFLGAGDLPIKIKEYV